MYLEARKFGINYYILIFTLLQWSGTELPESTSLNLDVEMRKQRRRADTKHAHKTKF